MTIVKFWPSRGAILTLYPTLTQKLFNW